MKQPLSAHASSERHPSMSISITCPNCAFSFEPSAVQREVIEKAVRKEVAGEQAALVARTRELEDAVRNAATDADKRVRDEATRVRAATEKQLRAKLDLELDEMSKKLAVANRDRAELMKRGRELDERARSMDLELEKRVAAERGKLAVKIEKETRDRYELAAADAMRAKEQELADAKKRLDAFAVKERELVKRAADLEDAQRRAAIEQQRRVQDEVKRARETLAQESNHQRALLESEHAQQIEQAKKQIEQLQQKLAQKSQQTHGEAQELVLLDVLEGAFRRDELEDVGKGEHGADIVHTVRDDRGLDGGKILWESKRRKSWSDAWIAKARDDQAAEGADLVVIVTSTMPADIKHFGERGGVWICSPTFSVALGDILRVMVLELAEARRATHGQTEKIQLLYQYLTSAQFKSRIHDALESFAEMEHELARERRATLAMWKRREQHLLRARTNLAAMYGDIRGIAGKQIEPIEEFELPAPEPRALTEGDDLAELLYEIVPAAATSNGTLLERFRLEARARFAMEVGEPEYQRAKGELVAEGRVEKGPGRGGTLRRAAAEAAAEE